MKEVLSSPTFVTGILALIGTFGGIFLKEHLDRQRRKEVLAILLKSEIDSIVELIESNEYLTGLAQTIENLQQQHFDVFRFSAKRSFTKVFDANLSDLGLLNSCAPQIVRFYAIANSAIEDKDQIDHDSAILAQHQLSHADIVFPSLIESHRTLLAKLQQVMNLGRAASSSLADLIKEFED